MYFEEDKENLLTYQIEIWLKDLYFDDFNENFKKERINYVADLLKFSHLQDNEISEKFCIPRTYQKLVLRFINRLFDLFQEK